MPRLTKMPAYIVKLMLHPEQWLSQMSERNWWMPFAVAVGLSAIAGGLSTILGAARQQISAAGATVAVDALTSAGNLTLIWLLWLIGVFVLVRLDGQQVPIRSAASAVGLICLPLAVRALVQVVFMLISNQPLGRPGLSGIADADSPAIVRSLLSQIDLFRIWQVGVAAECLRRLSPLNRSLWQRAIGLGLGIGITLALAGLLLGIDK